MTWFEKRRFVVTGGGGFLGQAVVEALKGEGITEFAPPAGQLFNRSGPSVQGAFYVVRDRFLQVTGGFSVVTDPDNIERAISRVNTLWRSSRS